MQAQSIVDIELHEVTRERFLNYAVSVITSRALPDVRDGLKPVQRRILYTMFHDLHLSPEKSTMATYGCHRSGYWSRFPARKCERLSSPFSIFRCIISWAEESHSRCKKLVCQPDNPSKLA